MSRRRLYSLTIGLAILLPVSGTSAQEQPELTAEEVIQNAETAYGPPPPEPKCEQTDEDIIVVCGQLEDQDQFRVKSSSELDPESEEALDDGLPRAPDVAGPGIFKGPATVGKLCILGLQKCPPPPAIEVDFSQLPEAPPGSDADRIGRGLAPIGNDVGTAPQIAVDTDQLGPIEDAAEIPPEN